MQITYDAAADVLIPAAEPKEMLSCRVDGDSVRVRINFSSLSLIQECLRKFEYVVVRKLRSNLESPATLFGTAIHKGLEVFYSGDASERTLPPNFWETSGMIGFGHWEPEWEKYLLFRSLRGFVEKAKPLAALPAENKRSAQTGVWLLGHYLEKNLEDPYVVFCGADGKPIVEHKFTMPLGSYVREDGRTVHIDAFGQIDVVLRHTVNGDILPADHKTTSQLGAPFYQRIDPNFQYTMYLWAAREVLGLQTNSFLVNALQVKEKPKTARGSAPQFARQITHRDEGHFAELRTAIFDSVEAHVSRLLTGRPYPMNTPGPCSNYGGCQFHDVCAAPTQLRETILKTKFNGGINADTTNRT